MSILTHATVASIGDAAPAGGVGTNAWNADHAETIVSGSSNHEQDGVVVQSSDTLTVAGTLRVVDAPLAFMGNFRPGSQTIRSDQYLLQFSSLTLVDGATLTVEPTGQLIVFDLPSMAGQLTISGRA